MQNILISYQFFEITLSIIFTFLGASIAIWMLSRTVHEKKLSLKFLGDHILLFSLSAIFTGRLGVLLIPMSHVISDKMYAATYWHEKAWIYIESFFSFWHGGVNFIWALIGFLTTFLVLCVVKNEHPLSWMDSFSLPAVFFLIFYSLGAFFSGSNYGKPAPEWLPFPVQYNLQDVQYSGPIFPVQIYEAILFTILFFIAWRFWEKSIAQNWPSGIFGGIILSSLCFILFALEFLRWTSASSLVLEFIPMQGLLLFLMGMGILLFMFWRGHFWVFSRFQSKFERADTSNLS